MSRAAEALINLSALQSNLELVRTRAPDARIVAVIKANGYGHGLLRIAQALEAVDALAVASIDEALSLRQAGINQPLLLLEGFFSADELPLIQQHQLSIVVHHEGQLQALEHMVESQTLDPQHRIPVWLKIDTGMSRLGFEPGQFAEALVRLRQCPLVDPAITVMTHLANADDRHDGMTDRQLNQLKEVLSNVFQTIDLKVSIANSAGILGWPEILNLTAQEQWVRPGIMLYGVSPFIDSTAQDEGLRPVMTLRSRVIAIKKLRAGDEVGYGGCWRCPEDMMLGVVAIGYGDGYPRSIQSDTPVLINGQRLPIVGRVSMDMLTIDLRQQPGVVVGDEVILWGEGLAVEEIAARAETIGYDLLCGVTPRVRFVECTDEGSVQ